MKRFKTLVWWHWGSRSPVGVWGRMCSSEQKRTQTDESGCDPASAELVSVQGSLVAVVGTGNRENTQAKLGWRMIYLHLKLESGFKPGSYFKHAFLLMNSTLVFIFCGLCFFFLCVFFSGSVGRTLQCFTQCAKTKPFVASKKPTPNKTETPCLSLKGHGSRYSGWMRSAKHRSPPWRLCSVLECSPLCFFFTSNPPFPEIFYLEHLHWRAWHLSLKVLSSSWVIPNEGLFMLRLIDHFVLSSHD